MSDTATGAAQKENTSNAIASLALRADLEKGTTTSQARHVNTAMIKSILQVRPSNIASTARVLRVRHSIRAWRTDVSMARRPGMASMVAAGETVTRWAHRRETVKMDIDIGAPKVVRTMARWLDAKTVIDENAQKVARPEMARVATPPKVLGACDAKVHLKATARDETATKVVVIDAPVALREAMVLLRATAHAANNVLGRPVLRMRRQKKKKAIRNRTRRFDLSS
jgi:hypothetical protein